MTVKCPICGGYDVEDDSVWCRDCKQWIDVSDVIDELQKEIAALKEDIRKRDEFAQQRIAIEESRPPLSMGKPCPKCGQTVR